MHPGVSASEHRSRQDKEIVTVHRGVDMRLLDGILTEVERLLLDAGAERIRVTNERPGVTVVAAMPTEAP